MTADHDVLIVGGGPAGMMAGYLFARAGVAIKVIEKHDDFFRDFRGDTVHPSTMEILDQLGLLERFLERPHNRLKGAELDIAGRRWIIGDLTHLDTPAPFIAMMPQWEFLDFLRDEARALPSFELRMNAPVASFVDDGRTYCGRSLALGRDDRGEARHCCGRAGFDRPFASDAAAGNAQRADGRPVVSNRQEARAAICCAA